ncbi:hypothetical protein L6270_02155 [Candidatus Parcubacteria bacterium]|nr:hypothetical protein [Patescibacteria group bacterium]MBU4309459.1 hypothetical protein [Patescibacteria group bacterium]MBU4432421.1 hypothetical protein [Patescibacteria group bacterium]MBU4577820.1 hypothetical protein [Patescibacteria group bacterium]MCG2696813.1 hypothetical protein [Candidatus Parcubacteria bacterium]
MLINIIAVLICIVMFFEYREKNKKTLEELAETNKWFDGCKDDLSDVTAMRHNVEIVKFPDGKHYAVLSIYSALKSLVRMDMLVQGRGEQMHHDPKDVVQKRKQYDTCYLVYDESTSSETRIPSMAVGERMLIFPVPEGREKDLSFKVRAVYQEEYMGNMQTFVESDLFLATRTHAVRQ